MKRRLTIAVCSNTAFSLFNFRAGLIKALIAEGHRVVAVAPEQAPYVDKLRQLGAEFIPWSLSGRSTNPGEETRALLRLVGIYRYLRPDIAFHYTIKAVIYGAIASARGGFPCVSVITGLGYVFLNSGWSSRIARALYRFTLKRSAEVWFLNTDDCATFQQLQLVNGVKTLNLPGEGVDMQYFAAAPLPSRGSESPERTFLMVARLLRDKGVLELVEAARRLRYVVPGIRFQLLGAADDENPTAISRVQVDEWVAEGVVEYLGVASDVRPFVARAHCIVLPSYREGVPRTLLEAAAMERPVVATDVPGCRDVVVPQKSGLLCRPRDATDLAEKIMAVARMDDASLMAMGRFGRQHVAAHFDERIVIDAYLSAIDRLIGTCGERATRATGKADLPI
jgi:glycosyltransferase involved in cell wall biosynthesis